MASPRRDSLVTDEQWVSTEAVKRIIWRYLRRYLQIRWEQLLQKVSMGKMRQEDVSEFSEKLRREEFDVYH